jgi:ribosomal protein S18 acetylase RimI-like enzyme
MSAPLAAATNRATADEIAAHLRACDHDFVPTLSSRVDLTAYACKLVSHAMRLETWSGKTLVALAVIYCNDRETHRAYLSSLSVLPEWRGRGLALQLLAAGFAAARAAGMETMALQVGRANIAAIALYRRAGFVPGDCEGDHLAMHLSLPQPA